MTAPIRNRIKSHRRVRAGDLVPHELNFRLHPDQQKTALQALYAEVGFVRSLLAYELPDGQIRAGGDYELVSASPELFDAGLHLHAQRLDKDWSLTDCKPH